MRQMMMNIRAIVSTLWLLIFLARGCFCENMFVIVCSMAKLKQQQQIINNV